jgi:hypothetical protein
VVREKLRLRFGLLWKLLFEYVRDAGVQVLAPGLKQGAVGGILDQGVLEAVGGVRWRAAAEDELGRDQLVEGGLQLRLRPVGDRGEQRVRELPANRGADLGDLLDRGQAI